MTHCTCPTCGGNGTLIHADGSHYSPCPRCAGTGAVERSLVRGRVHPPLVLRTELERDLDRLTDTTKETP